MTPSRLPAVVRHLPGIAIAILFFTIHAFGTAANVPMWRSPLPQGNDLYAMAYGNSRFVAVGRSSARVEQAAWVDGTCVLLADVVFAHAREGSAAEWPEAARSLLQRLVDESAALRP